MMKELLFVVVFGIVSLSFLAYQGREIWALTLSQSIPIAQAKAATNATINNWELYRLTESSPLSQSSSLSQSQSLPEKEKREIGNNPTASPTASAKTAASNATKAPGKNWELYRLGDWVLGSGGTSGMTKQSWFHDTLAWEYASELDRRSNGTLIRKNRPRKYIKEAFCGLVKKRGEEQGRAINSPPLPRPEDLVLHLRLGDTLDETMLLEEVEDAFEYGISIVPSQIRLMINKGNTHGWWKYVKSKCYYENVLKKIEEVESAKAVGAAAQPNKRLIIVGSPMHRHKKTGSNSISMKYAELVRKFFADRGYEVQSRLDGMPDDDMVWMSHSPVFVAAGGGFSRLVSDCVEYLGGVSLRPEEELEKPCWTVPKPAIDLKNYSWEKAGWHGKGPWSGCKNYPPEKTIWGGCSF